MISPQELAVGLTPIALPRLTLAPAPLPGELGASLTALLLLTLTTRLRVSGWSSEDLHENAAGLVLLSGDLRTRAVNPGRLLTLLPFASVPMLPGGLSTKLLVKEGGRCPAAGKPRRGMGKLERPRASRGRRAYF